MWGGFVIIINKESVFEGGVCLLLFLEGFLHVFGCFQVFGHISHLLSSPDGCQFFHVCFLLILKTMNTLCMITAVVCRIKLRPEEKEQTCGCKLDRTVLQGVCPTFGQV